MDENTKIPQDNETAEEDNIVMLLDENGEEHPFEHLDSFEFNGDVYVCMASAEEGEDSDEVLIFTLSTDDEGKEALLLVEDEAELDMAFEEFKKRMQEEFDFE